MTATALCPRTIDLGAVRAALATSLRNITYDGHPLRVNEWLADTINPPAAFIGAFRVMFIDDNYAGMTTATVPVRLVVPVAALRPAQQALDEILGVWYSGLQADTTLQGTVRSVNAVEAIPIVVANGNADLPAYECETRLIL